MWAHNEHVGQTLSDFTNEPMGIHLQRSLGSGYVAIGTFTGAGVYRQWEPRAAPQKPRTILSNVPAPGAGSYESNFKLGPAPAMLIPLALPVPPWLAGPAQYFIAGTAPLPTEFSVSLPQKFDAVVYIDTTRETTPLRPD